MTLVDFTLSNATQFYSSCSGEPLGNKRVNYLDKRFTYLEEEVNLSIKIEKGRRCKSFHQVSSNRLLNDQPGDRLSL